MIGRSQKTAS